MKIFFIDRASSCINVWWINIEAENHVCYDKNLFDEQTYRKVIENSIVTANNEAVVIIEKDMIIINILLKNQSIKIQLNDVYHCSKLHYNLMSVEQVKVKEYTCSIQKDKFLFIDSMRIIVLIDSRSDEKFYFVNASTNFSNFQTLTSRTHESIRASWCQWHKRLAHLNMTDVKRLVNMSINIDVNSINSLEEKEFSESICETCVLDKQHRAFSWRFHTRVIRIDELIYLNLIDDDKILMIDEEFRYVVTMIDDYSQYTIIYLIDRKFDLKDVLRNYLNLIKNRDTLIHWLRSDNEEKYADHQRAWDCYEHVWINQSSDLILINLIRTSHDAMPSLNLAHLFESFSTLLLVVQHFLHSSLSSFF